MFEIKSNVKIDFDKEEFKPKKPFKKCTVEGCENHAPSKGLCEKHRGRLRRTGNVSDRGSKLVEKNKNEVERFHLKYEKQENGCWLWIGGTRPNARGVKYGRLTLDDGTGTGAHRFSYKLFKGEIPEKMQVCHKCDTPLCVNPDHLFLGTAKDNAEDMVSKNRQNKNRGEDKKGRAKLTNKQAEEIRNLNMSQSEIAKMYGIAQATVSRIKNGVSY